MQCSRASCNSRIGVPMVEDAGTRSSRIRGYCSSSCFTLQTRPSARSSCTLCKYGHGRSSQSRAWRRTARPPYGPGLRSARSRARGPIEWPVRTDALHLRLALRGGRSRPTPRRGCQRSSVDSFRPTRAVAPGAQKSAPLALPLEGAVSKPAARASAL